MSGSSSDSSSISSCEEKTFKTNGEKKSNAQSKNGSSSVPVNSSVLQTFYSSISPPSSTVSLPSNSFSNKSSSSGMNSSSNRSPSSSSSCLKTETKKSFTKNTSNKSSPSSSPPSSVSPFPSTSSSSSSPSCLLNLSTRDSYIRKASFLTSRNRLSEALLVYDEALKKFSNDSDLYNCKGVCLRNLNKPDEAMECYNKALALDSNNASACNNKGVIYKERDEYDKAIQCYLHALSLDRHHRTATTNLAVALTDLGTKLKSEGRHKEALEKYHEAIRTDPTYSPCFYNLGVIHSEMGDYQCAIGMYNDAIKLNPRYVEAYNNLGAICKNMGQLQQAIMFYERALHLNPNFEMSKGNIAVALTDLGTQIKTQGNIKEGVRLYKKALVYNPYYADAYYNLGVAYGEQFKYDKALVYYQLAISFNPRCAEAYNNLGVIYKDRENLDKAIYFYSKALEVNPNFSQTLNNIGVIYTVVGKMTEAHEYTRRAIEANPNYAEAYNNMGVLYRDQGDVHLAVQAYEKCIAIDPNSRNALQNRLLALNYLHTIPVEAIYEASLDWGNKFISSRKQYTSWNCDINHFNQNAFSVTKNKNNATSRLLRIGYISPDFFTHSVSYFIHAPLVHHDKKKVHITVYSNVIKEDDKTQMFKALCDEWKSVVNVSDAEVARRVHEDKIDVLVELTGHTANNRLDVMAFKPAPVQVTWIGYPNTTGLSTVDYRITDSIVDPPTTKQPYVEKLYRMPNCFLCYTPYHDLPDICQKTPAIENQFVTFGSFNNVAKMGTNVIKLWSEVLLLVPESRLLVKAKPFANSVIQKRFVSQFESFGVSADRLDLMGLIPQCADHLKTYGLMDIALDTFPYAGTTTTCESLLMGVPIVVLKTENNHAHNVGVSLLTNMGLDELIAENEKQFVQIAVQLAKSPERLIKYRETIRSRMLKSPLCDGAVFARHLEYAYAEMYNNYVQKMKKSGGKITSSSPTVSCKNSTNVLNKQKKNEDNEEGAVGTGSSVDRDMNKSIISDINSIIKNINNNTTQYMFDSLNEQKSGKKKKKNKKKKSNSEGLGDANLDVQQNAEDDEEEKNEKEIEEKEEKSKQNKNLNKTFFFGKNNETKEDEDDEDDEDEDDDEEEEKKEEEKEEKINAQKSDVSKILEKNQKFSIHCES